MQTQPVERARADDTPGPPVGSPGRPRGWLWVRELVVVALAALGVVLVVVGPLPLDTPVVHRGDTFQHLALIESADWTGSPGVAEDLGAPHGVDWSVFPTGGDRVHLVVLNALDELTGDAVVAMNLHVLLVLVATAVLAHAALRWLGSDPLVAGAASVVFALSPAALQRLAVGHLFLFGLFPVVLAVVLTLWATAVPPPRTLRPRAWVTDGWLARRRWTLPLLAAVLLGISGAYFAVFGALVLAVVAGVIAVRHGDPRRLVAPALVLLVLCATTAASLAPDLLARRGDPAVSSLHRPVSDSDTYGLRLAQMVLPRPGHPVEPLAEWGERAVRTRAPGDPGARLGLLGTAGLVCLGVTVVRRLGRPRDRTDRLITRLGAIAAAALLLGTAGGGGFVLATLGLTQVRAWSRLAPFAMFCALAALALFVSRRWPTERESADASRPAARTVPAARVALLVLPVAVLALVDQGLWPTDRAARDASREDSALVEDLVEALGPGSAVAQLPPVSFPDDVGSERLLAPAHHAGGRLRFTAGAFRGGPGDWQQSWLVGDADRAVRAAAAAGFDALLIQRSHSLVADPDELEREVAAEAGDRVKRSTQQTWAWVDLRPLHARLVEEHGAVAVERAGAGVVRPLSVTFEGSVATEHSADGVRTALGPQGKLVIHDHDGGSGNVRVRFEVEAADGAIVRIETSTGARTLRPGAGGSVVELEVPVTGGVAGVAVTTDGAALRVPGSDGPAHVRVGGFRVLDAATAASDVLGPS